MRRMILILTLIIGIATSLYAPTNKVLYIEQAIPISSYDALIRAVVAVESGGNNLAYNEKEQACGAFQIRPVRLSHYNHETGNNYKLSDMYNYDISKEIFIYFANKQDKDFEMIARSWNGRGPKTIEYWNKVKSRL
jgi:hypothetical protein